MLLQRWQAEEGLSFRLDKATGSSCSGAMFAIQTAAVEGHHWEDPEQVHSRATPAQRGGRESEESRSLRG